MKQNKLVVKLNPSAEKMVRRNHPWVFESGIKQIKGEGNVGDLSVIFDSKSNKFLAIGLYDPFSPIRIKVLQAIKPQNIDEKWFKEKIKQAFDKRKPLLIDKTTNAYRVIFGENDNFPSLIADVYDSVLVVKLYSAIWFKYLNEIAQILKNITGVSVVVLRLSRNLEKISNEYTFKNEQILIGELKNPNITFKEHNVFFRANVIKGHKTGFFLDHRHNRKRVGELSKNKTVLDVFSYAGGFSVHALVGGAKKVVSVDISKKALELAKENAKLNNTFGEHQTLANEAFTVLRDLTNNKQKFDIVVIDPPSFAKQQSEIQGALRAYTKLCIKAAQLLNKSGILVMASCSARVSANEFFNLVETVLKSSKRKFEIIDKTYHDIDHPIAFKEGAYLKAIYCKIHS